MTKNQSLLFRALLFFAGIGIIALAFQLSNGDTKLTKIDKFVWVSIILMYLVFFTPFFFSSIRIANFSVKVPNIIFTWLGILVYVVASIIVLVLLKTEIIPVNQSEVIESYLIPQEPRYYLTLNQAIVIQAILVFLFLINVYFSYFASSHVSSVAREEAVTRMSMGEIKSSATVLDLAVKQLPTEYEGTQKVISRALDDLKYVSPVNNASATEIEAKIMVVLAALSQGCETISSGGSPIAFDSDAQKLALLVKQRKLLKN